MPAEWAPHEATWVAWPSHADLWLENLAPARAAFARMVAAIAAGEAVHVLVPDAEQETAARSLSRAAVGDGTVTHEARPGRGPGEGFLADTGRCNGRWVCRKFQRL